MLFPLPGTLLPPITTDLCSNSISWQRPIQSFYLKCKLYPLALPTPLLCFILLQTTYQQLQYYIFVYFLSFPLKFKLQEGNGCFDHWSISAEKQCLAHSRCSIFVVNSGNRRHDRWRQKMRNSQFCCSSFDIFGYPGNQKCIFLRKL